tara:strand:+ start:1980 stop:5414 length:3435 start_codon:yes stop_codon:yes gene_type:complete
MSTRWILNDRFSVKREETRKGGTATVYRALDLETEKTVAIKMFNNTSMKMELTIEAFQRELRSLEELNGHENIAKIVDFGKEESSGNNYIAMEWLEDSLLDVVGKHEIECWDDFYIHYGKPILEALSFSHKRDIIHRDVKPANILFTNDGVLRVVDFGISKYKAWWGSNVTFLGWNSKPYAPPENDNYRYVNTRDIYSFAVLALACLERRELEEDENVLELIKNHPLSDGVVDILERCLSYSPEDRIQSIDELINQLDRQSNINGDKFDYKNAKCHLSLTTKAIQQLQISISISDKTAIEKHVERELNEACSLARKNINNNTFNFISVEHSYLVAVDEITKSHFVVIGVARRESWILENRRASGFSPNVRYIVGRPPSSKAVLASTEELLEAFSEYEENAVERNKKAKEDNLINTWKSQLRLQLDLERIASNEVSYDRFDIEDDQISFYLGAGEWGGMIGQERIIKSNGSKSISITINRASKEHVCSSAEFVDTESMPIKGSLCLDTKMQAISRIRQEEALDDVIFERSYRADLKRIIFNSKKLDKFVPKDITKFLQSDLDDIKKNAVCSSLAMKDFLVINGPPGTGKTKVIAEIALQYLKENPDAKILISSQTHNAIDNAIERIREVWNDDESLGAVRLGRKDDQRISNSVKDLLLDNLVSIWLKGVKEKSTAYLESWADKMGVDKNEIELGLSVRILRKALVSIDSLVTRREEIQSEIKKLDGLISNLKISEKKPEELELHLFNKDKFIDQLRETDDLIIRAKRKTREAQSELESNFIDGKELIKSGHEELLEWEEAFLKSSVEREKCRNVIELLQDWYDRFGRTTDFNASYLSDSHIVAATCIGIGLKSYRDIRFDLCIVDEASKATPTESLLPVVKSKKWIFVGDQAQLPPFVQEGANNKHLLEKHNLKPGDLKKTLLDHLLSISPAENIISLSIQYRMRPEIGNLVSRIFYGDKLKTGRGKGVPFEDYFAVTKPVTWYCTSEDKRRFESREGSSYINRVEANCISSILKRFNFAAKTLMRIFSVSVLSFYSSQKSILISEVARISTECTNLNISCDTVDAFQGREADICIISVTRCNTYGELGFVNDMNRINVALSRGKEALVIVGDSSFCTGAGHGNPLGLVIDYINENNSECALTKV